MAKIPYRNVIGNFMFCMVTMKLDIVIVVGVGSIFQQPWTSSLACCQTTFHIFLGDSKSCVALFGWCWY